MCTQYYITYTCSYRQETDFIQCDKLLNTKYKCEERDIQYAAQEPIGHYCEAHLVDADEWVAMRKDVDEDEGKNQEEQDAEYSRCHYV